MLGHQVPPSLVARICFITCSMTLLIAAATNPAHAQGTSDKSKVGSVITSTKSFKAVFADLDKCPADLSPDFIVPYVSQTQECAESPSSCFDRCVEADDANDCFALALTIQENEALDKKYAEALFARSCAEGLPGACTNRAAGMMKAHRDNPAAKLPSGESVQDCVARSFKETCSVQDTWGCTMHGIVLRDGIGTDKDENAALESFKKACEIAPQSKACQHASSEMKTIEN